MDYQSFYAQLRQGAVGKVYLFEGEEEYSKESALKALRTALLRGPMAMMNMSTLINPEERELIALCETLPVMEDRRLVVVKDSSLLQGRLADGDEEEPRGNSGRAGRDSLFQYLDSLPEHVCLVFFVRGKAAGSKRLFKKIRELGGVVSFEPLDGEMLIKWVARELKEFGKKIERQTAEQLIFACGREMMTLKGEIAKLAAHAGEREAVTREDIDAVATLSAEYRVFDLAEKVADGKARQALPMLKNMLAGGEQRLMLISLLQRHYRQLFITRLLMDEGQPPAAISTELGIPVFVERRLEGSARVYTADTLRRAYRLCIGQEYLIKSGRINEEGSLEGLVFSLLQVRNALEAAGD